MVRSAAAPRVSNHEGHERPIHRYPYHLISTPIVP